MFWLLIIGLIHLVFLWIGDILTLYALLGLVLIWFVNLNSKKLLIWAAVLIVLPVPNWLFISFFGWDFPSYFYDLNVQYNQSLGLPIYQWQGISMTDFLAYLENDNFLYFFKVNIGNSIIRFADILAKGRAFKVLGIFLIGLWAGRKILQEQAIIGSFGTDLIFEATFNTGIHGGYPLGSRSRITYMFNDSWINNPNGLSTSVDEIVIASGNAIMTSNTICKTLTINPGASLTIDANVSLTTTTTTLQSISTSYSSLITNGAIIGTVNYERFINASSNGNDLISPPLDGQSWSSFIGLASNESALLQNPSDVTMYAFAPFNKADDAYTNYTISITANLPSGTGYRAATNSGSVLIFTGTVPTSNVVVNIEYNASAVYKEWNLIGNPYPSYLNTNVFLNHEVVTGVNDYSLGEEDSQGIYGYNGISGGLAVVNLANASANPITPGQGFFMSADNAKVIPYDLTFTPSMQIPGTGDDFISERSTNILTYLRLKASTSITNYTTDIYFNTNASRGLDFGYDSKMFGSNQNFILYSHLVVGNVGTSIALQTLHVNDLSNTTIPLGIVSNIGETITFSAVDFNLPSHIDVNLHDTFTNISTEFNSTDYVVTPTTNLSGTGRFYINFTDTSLSVIDNDLEQINLYASTLAKTLTVNGVLTSKTELQVFDIQGRLVYASPLASNVLSQTILLKTLNSGLYVVSLISGNKIQKIILC